MKRAILVGMSLLVLAGPTLLVVSLMNTPQAQAHCQVPCGIYDDTARVHAMEEDVKTITKAMNQINELAAGHDALKINQVTRWINTKEEHASHVIETVSVYFLTQKVKVVDAGAAGYDDYLKKLADHHVVMSAAMKCKQTVDASNAAALGRAIEALAKHYPHNH
jgi:nickel superoxide dismutase